MKGIVELRNLFKKKDLIGENKYQIFIKMFIPTDIYIGYFEKKMLSRSNALKDYFDYAGEDEAFFDNFKQENEPKKTFLNYFGDYIEDIENVSNGQKNKIKDKKKEIKLYYIEPIKKTLEEKLNNTLEGKTRSDDDKAKIIYALCTELREFIFSQLNEKDDSMSGKINEYLYYRIHRIEVCENYKLITDVLLPEFLATYFIYLTTSKILILELSESDSNPNDFTKISLPQFITYKDDKAIFEGALSATQALISDQTLAIIDNLADNENVSARYEEANLLYYGRGFTGQQDKINAIKNYLDIYNSDKYYPLVHWNIADFMMDYLHGVHQKDKEYVEIYEIFEGWRKEKDKFYKKLLGLCLDGISIEDPRSYNLLGRIIEADDSIFPSEYKGKYKDKSLKKVNFQIAADLQNMYGCSNLAACYAEENNSKDAINYLEKAAKAGQPYSLFKCALLYTYGKTVIRGYEVEDKEKILLEKARRYLKKARKYTGDGKTIYAYAYDLLEYELGEKCPKNQDNLTEKKIELLKKSRTLAEERIAGGYGKMYEISGELAPYVNPKMALSYINSQLEKIYKKF